MRTGFLSFSLSLPTTSHTHAENLTPLLLASNSGHYITVSADHQGTAPGHSPLEAPSSELLCGPAQSLNYGPAKRGILLQGDVPICWPLQKTDRYKWPKF